MSTDDRLNEAVESKTEAAYLSNRIDIAESYQDKYGLNWRKHIVDDILRVNPELKRASVQRQFQHDKRTGQDRYLGAGRMSGSTKSIYESLGKTLPSTGRKLKGDSITVTVQGKQSMGTRGGTRDRTITVTFKGANAQKFINDPSYRDIWSEFGVEPDLFEDGDYAIDVYSVA